MYIENFTAIIKAGECVYVLILRAKGKYGKGQILLLRTTGAISNNGKTKTKVRSGPSFGYFFYSN